MNDTQDLIGRLLHPSVPRDAIHIAVAPVVAAVTIRAGQPIGLDEAGNATPSADPIGVADPFLRRPVAAGDRFFLFLNPNTVTGMRHLWAHPAFDGPRAESEAWLREFATHNEGDYHEMLASALSGEGYCFGTDIDYSDFNADSEFWRHVEAVSGKHITNEQRERTYFRCSC